MSTKWLITEVFQSSSKGSTQNTTTEDNTTSTTNLGARTTTANRGARSNTGSNTVTEDAGGQVSFVIKINGGLNTDAANPAVCET